MRTSLDELRKDCSALADHIENNCRDWIDGHLTAVRRIQRKTLKPRPRLRVDQVTDKYRYIPSTASANHGKFRVSTYEVARGPMLAVTEPGVRIITVCAATQLMKTTLLESTALYFMLVDPCPMIIVEANQDLAREVSQTKIGGMIDNTPEARSVMFKSTIERKPFIGGILKIVTAQSENALKSFSARVTMCDEIDGYKVLPGGNAVALTEKRSSSHGERALNIRVCSPTVEKGNIWQSVLDGDQRQPYVACPCCGYEQVMRWKPNDIQRAEFEKYNEGEKCPDTLVRWEVDPSTGNWLLDTSAYHCLKCNTGWSEGQRLKALEVIKWRQTRTFNCCETYQDPQVERNWEDVHADDDGKHLVGYASCKTCGKRAVPNRHASFYGASRLYSPHPLSEMVAGFKEAQKSTADLIAFVNSDFAEIWHEIRGVKHSADGLAARAEDFEGFIPARCVILVAGVDTQDDRLEYVITGYGRENEIWVLEYGVIMGSPQDPDTWRQLDEVLGADRQTRPDDKGAVRKLRVSAACIDYGGHNGQAVYRYCLDRQALNRWPIMGENEQGSTVATIWPKTPTYIGSAKIAAYRVGTTAAKTALNRYLGVTLPGRFFVHFSSELRSEWYAGILSEEQKMKSGVWRWVHKDGARNEPLDTMVYAMAAMEGLRAQQKDPLLVEHLADRLGIGRTMTTDELVRFANADEAARIAEETQKSLEQGRAKPIKNEVAAKRALDKKANRKAANTPPKRQQKPETPPRFANSSENESQYVQSDRPTQRNGVSPRRKPAPFRW